MQPSESQNVTSAAPGPIVGTRRQPRAVVALLLLAILTTWISPFTRELLIGDETKYTRVLHETLESGGWMVLRLGGEPYAHKPPVHFWMLGVLSFTFGQESIFTFVLPSLVAFILTIVVIGKATASITGGRGAVATAVFASFWLAWVLAQTARMDHSFTLLITLGAIAIFGALHRGWRWGLIVAAVCGGLAILVKGPMAGIILIFLYGLESIRLRRRPRRIAAGALLILIVIPLLWLIPAITIGGAGYGEDLLVKQSLGRAFGSWVHASPPWFYILHFPIDFMPWFPLVGAGLWNAWRVRREDSGGGFLLSWFAAVFVPYSVISGKLDVYMLPALVPAAMLVEREVRALGARARNWMLGVACVLFALFVIVTVGVPFLPRSNPDFADISRLLPGWIWAGTGSVVLLILAATWRTSSIPRFLLGIGAIAIVPLIALTLFGAPALNETSSTRPLISELESTGVEPDRIALYWTPHLWAKGMNPDFHRVRYAAPSELESPPEIVAVRRDHADEIAAALAAYDEISTIRLDSKEIDVYRRR